jgi:hypothetical protein
MCGGGGGNAAADAANQAEADRQSRIKTNVASIDAAYGNREPQYADYVAALRKQYGTELARQQSQASRGLKFATARSGLTGGSAGIDANTELKREAAQGSITAESQARGQEAKLRSSDQQSRLGLVSLAQSGGDIGNAAIATSDAMRANLENAKSAGNAQALGDIFGNSAAAAKKSQDAFNLRKGYNTSLYGKPFGAP